MVAKLKSNKRGLEMKNTFIQYGTRRTAKPCDNPIFRDKHLHRTEIRTEEHFGSDGDRDYCGIKGWTAREVCTGCGRDFGICGFCPDDIIVRLYIMQPKEKQDERYSLDITPRYSKISELDVVNVIMGTAHDWQGCGVISPSNIAHLLNTSRYQVDKHIKALKKKGLLEYKSVMIGSEEDYYPPYNGYRLSKHGEIMYSKKLKELEREERDLIEKCFGV